MWTSRFKSCATEEPIDGPSHLLPVVAPVQVPLPVRVRGPLLAFGTAPDFTSAPCALACGRVRYTVSTSILILTGLAKVSYIGDLLSSSRTVASSKSPLTLNLTRISR